jgi:hypothetical protein
VTDPTARERQARFAERIREQGFVKICEWVPVECRDTLKRIARDMRDGVAPDPDYTPPPKPAPPQQQDETADRVRQASGWGWTHDPIAAPADCSDIFKRITAEMHTKVRQAHGWGWTPAAIANYLGISAEQVDRILGDGDAA